MALLMPPGGWGRSCGPANPRQSPENIEDLYTRFNMAPILGSGRFDEKFERQIGDGPRDVVRLAAEVVAVHFLFVSNVSAQAKRSLIGKILSWSGDELASDSELTLALDERIGSGGSGFNYFRPFEVAFVVDFARRFKGESIEERESLLADPWDFERWLDTGPEGQSSRQMRHIILHLLFPDHFERISSGADKQRIAKAFAGLVDNDEPDLDRRLYAIREHLTELLPKDDLDFYWEPLAQAWSSWADESEFGSIDALQYKRQVVLDGPPGTGKTYRASKLAELLIRRHALMEWGAARFFQDQDAVATAVEENVRRLQLHPSYSYEEFIRGLALGENGKMEYRPGFLLRLIDEMKKRPPGGRLPFVVILDEVNRVDLSRVLGEAFSLLADRDEDVALIGLDDERVTLRIPEDLYVIGTMNLIDQSVEQLDFALRRRFLWIPCNFDPDALIAILEAQWSPVRAYSWARVQPDMERLVEAAIALNERVRASELLGEQYEVGHTYFLDVIGFLGEHLAGRRSVSAFLWRNGKPEEPVKTLWRLSLQPLLREYLAGLDKDSREAELVALRQAFLGA